VVERRRLRRTLLPAPAVDVEVGKDPKQPGAQVRPGRELLPGAEGALVRLLHEILRFFAGTGQTARDPVHLVAQAQRLFFESHTSTRLLGEPAGVSGRRCALTHPAATLATVQTHDSRA